MTVPDFQSVMLPMLRITEDRAEHNTGEVIDRLANEFSLRAEDREELLPSGTQRRFDNRSRTVGESTCSGCRLVPSRLALAAVTSSSPSRSRCLPPRSTFNA